jgi:hypothetical protein
MNKKMKRKIEETHPSLSRASILAIQEGQGVTMKSIKNNLCERCGEEMMEVHSSGYNEPPFYCSEKCYSKRNKQ